MNSTLKKAAAEFLGVALFLTSIIAATQIESRDGGFANVALAGTLAVAILLTASTSGGHLNPAVSFYFFAKKAISGLDLATYVAAQLAGAAVGVQLGALLTGAMFTPSSQAASVSDIVGELIAATVLIWLIGHLAATEQANKIPVAVGVWVLAASLFTPSGAQANPAVSFGLLFAGKSVTYVGAVVVAQIAAALLALVLGMFVTNPVKKSKSKK